MGWKDQRTNCSSRNGRSYADAEIRREEEGKIRIIYRLEEYETKFSVVLREHIDMLRGRIEFLLLQFKGVWEQ